MSDYQLLWLLLCWCSSSSIESVPDTCTRQDLLQRSFFISWCSVVLVGDDVLGHYFCIMLQYKDLYNFLYSVTTLKNVFTLFTCLHGEQK